MADHVADAVPTGARTAVDVYKAGRLAAHLWREGDEVSFAYTPEYLRSGGPAVAFTLPQTATLVRTSGLRLPPFFAGLLPEGESRRRDLQRAFHVAADDELGLLAIVGADTIGDVQVVASGAPLPAEPSPIADWSQVSFASMWRELPGPRTQSALPGVQPKMSARSRSLHGGGSGGVILKLPIAGWHGVLDNEHLFMSNAVIAGLRAAKTAVVVDADGREALAVTRFDRCDGAGGDIVRRAQEDAAQVLGLRPGEKYDPDARTVIGALAQRCAAPRVAVRDLFRQLLYSYVIGNNDLHAKNLSIYQAPTTGVWSVTPAYDVLHTWPYEGDHRFVPAVRPDGPHDSVIAKWWNALAGDVGLPARALTRMVGEVTAPVGSLIAAAASVGGLSEPQRRDVRRVLTKRARDVTSGS